VTVRQDQDGKWFVEVDRKGMPRVRRGGFESKEAADIFEREYIAKYRIHHEQTTDKRTLKELVEIWHICHGINLDDGRRRRRALMKMADELKNPVASQLGPEQFISYRYRKTHGVNAISPKSFNTLHDYLDSVFHRLSKLNIITYTSPIDGVEFVKV
jgi:hypothetical protein